ncbi:MAG: phosphatidate cytidylyltransferase [Dehalococcoidales bacterium]|nr:MAG: phosphatidate cytidylyltransferase [Dehalococcoidales bacterium]
MLKQRIITALLLIPLPVAAVWFGEPWFTSLVVIFGVLAAFEFYRLGSTVRVSPVTYLGLVFTLLFIISRNPNLLSRIETNFDPVLVTPLLLATAIVLTLAGALLRRNKDGAIADWAWTMAGILYVGWLFGHAVALRGLADGRNWVFFVLLATVASDTMAFFIGSAIGRHKLAPQISPNKTCEGAVAGVVGAALFSLLFVPTKLFGLNNAIHIHGFSYGEAILLGVLVSIFGQLGDLAESLLKRNAKVKDSGMLFPGHGGVLDRLDSIIFAGVVVYYFAVL